MRIVIPFVTIGGPKELISHLLANERLETVEAAPDDPLWRDLPAWLLERIDAAADEVILSGSIVLTFAAGTVEVSLISLNKRGSAHIVARSTRPRSSGWVGGTSTVNSHRRDELRREVFISVHRAARALVSSV